MYGSRDPKVERNVKLAGTAHIVSAIGAIYLLVLHT